MKGIDWGSLYNELQGRRARPRRLEAQVAALMADEDVTKKKGIYNYVLTGRKSTSTSGLHREPEARGLRDGRRASARCARNTSSWTRWRPTTSRRGTKAARRCRELPDALPGGQPPKGRGLTDGRHIDDGQLTPATEVVEDLGHIVNVGTPGWVLQ